MNQMDHVSRGSFLRSKQTVTVAIDFLNWLTDHVPMRARPVGEGGEIIAG
jgi:hypothetical protein